MLVQPGCGLMSLWKVLQEQFQKLLLSDTNIIVRIIALVLIEIND